MTLTLKANRTKKITPKVKPSTSTDTKAVMQKLANRYKKVESELNSILKDPKVKKMEDELSDLKKKLVSTANEVLTDDESLVLKTRLGDVKIGKRGTSRSIVDMKLVAKFLGRDTFMKLAKVSLTDIDKYLNPDQVQECTVTKVTSTRRIS